MWGGVVGSAADSCSSTVAVLDRRKSEEAGGRTALRTQADGVLGEVGIGCDRDRAARALTSACRQGLAPFSFSSEAASEHLKLDDGGEVVLFCDERRQLRAGKGKWRLLYLSVYSVGDGA